MRTRDVTFYVQLEPRWSNYTNSRGEYWLSRVAATGITSKRTTRKMPSGAIEVQITMRVPESAFYPLRPQVVVEIPETATELIEAVVADVGERAD